MHKHNIVHRDLKLINILMQSKDPSNLDIKVADFGFACFFNAKKGDKMEEFLGTS